jgi:hypothetical protein
VISLLALMMAGLTCPVGQAIVNPTLPPSTENCVWVPAENGQGCGPTAHRHAMDLKENGKFVVNHQKGEFDIVFDGECHDNDKEFVCTPETTKLGVSTCTETGRKVLKP